ncbi:MAG: protein translocase subunit SecF [Spirochaetaceae bacterium]|nr:MAG: protein translocase subunit SecF [Spirochaetaceae bacterium]
MRKVIEFTRIRFVMIALSVVVIAAGLTGTIVQGGFNLGIDFQAGSTQRVLIDVPNVDVETVRNALGELPSVQVQSVGGQDSREFSIRVRDTGDIDNFTVVMSDRVLTRLGEAFGAGNITELENAYVGPRFAGDLAGQAAMLTTLALFLILIYLWFRFRLGYAVAAIATLLHDVVFMVGFIGALQIEVSTATIAAVLTIVGYSLNDTIVVFDRIRENETLLRESGFTTIVNTSITQSLSRTLITSVTTMLAVVSIFVFTTGAIQDFALNLMVGIVVGTYSSIFIASPTLLGWHRRSIARMKKRSMGGKYGKSSTETSPKRAVAASAATDVDAPAGEPVAVGAGPDVEAVRRELAQKRAGSASPAAGGKNVPRAKRKKKH